MPKIIPVHHSVADWDFTTGAHHALTEALFVSPPSCLYMYWQAGNPTFTAVLCRRGDTQVVPDGEVRTWYRTTNRTRGGFLFFRNQHALGGADHENCYIWSLAGASARLSRYVAGDATFIGDIPIVIENLTWYHFRTRFWSDKNPAGDDALNVELFMEEAGEWAKKGSTLYDTADQFKDSGINRLGIGGHTDGAPYHFFDDTEIWGPV